MGEMWRSRIEKKFEIDCEHKIDFDIFCSSETSMHEIHPGIGGLEKRVWSFGEGKLWHG
jgi:hypothetical protein